MQEEQALRTKLIMDERVRLYYGGLGVSGVGTILLSLVVAWLAGAPENETALLWGIVMLISGLAQSALWFAWLRNQPDIYKAWKWQFYPLLPMAVTGLCWGAAAAYPFPAYAGDTSLLLVLASGAGLLLNLILLSALELAISVFILSSLVPLAYSFSTIQPLPHSSTTAVILAAAIAMGLTAVALSVLSGIIARLRAGKRNVSGKLNLVKEEVEGLHSKLTMQHEKRKDVEEELYRAKGEAQTANMVKSEFLATISHEIRTPLNGIVPLLEILRDTNLDREQQQFVHTALNSSHHLMSIINDILDFSKIEAGKLELEDLDVDLHELVGSVISLMSKSAERRNLTLSYSFGEKIPRRALGDPIRIRQVLTNMVSNAIKFTESGTISVKVKLHQPTRRESELLFAVKDTGVGISKDVQSRLFQSFSQADASTTRKHGGTGLGLAISKRLVELMGGKIGVTSQEGKGSVFWFTLPFRKAQSEASSSRWTLHGLHILVVAKKGVQASKMKKLLDDWGANYDQISELTDAVPLLVDAASESDGYRYNLVIVDTHAYDDEVPRFLRELKDQPRIEGLNVVLLDGESYPSPSLTNDQSVTLLPLSFKKKDLFLQLCRLSDSEAPSRALLMGEDLDLDEPSELDMEQDYYLEAGDGLLDDAPPEQTSRLDEIALAGKVLIVEDNPVNLGVARKLLQRQGLECEVAEDGKAALNMIEETEFDLVLMDCQMPRMDGYEATRALRLKESTYGFARLPIVAMTANAMPGDKDKCLQAGMDDYIAKPLTPSSLRSTLRHWLPMKELLEEDSVKVSGLEIPLDVDADSVPEELADAETEQVVEHQINSLEVIDKEVITELYEIMEDDFTSLIEAFLTNSPVCLDQIEAGIREGDCKHAIIPAHSLKSSSANVGAMALSELAKKMEFAARDDDIDRLQDGIMELREEYDRSERELQGLCENTGLTMQ
ncbi:MAG: ATP-binding protein [Candidatus Sedimenticola sp. 6PFRAG7]